MEDSQDRRYEYFDGYVNNPSGGFISPEKAALEAVNMSYEATPVPGESDPTNFSIPPRASEIGQNAIDSSVDLGQFELTSTSDGSAVEHYVVNDNSDILVIGNNLEAVRLNKMTGSVSQPNNVVSLASRRRQRKPTSNASLNRDLGKTA